MSNEIGKPIERIAPYEPYKKFDLVSNYRPKPFLGRALIFVIGEEGSVGRNGFVNMAGSILGSIGANFAIIEFTTFSGSALRAYKAKGVGTAQINPVGDRHTAQQLIDAIQGFQNHVVIITISRVFWNEYVKIERLIINVFAQSHYFAFVFLTSSPTYTSQMSSMHKSKLSAMGAPDCDHYQAFRALKYPSSAKATSLTNHRHGTILIPWLDPATAALLLKPEWLEGSGKYYPIFAEVYARLTDGTRATMHTDLIYFASIIKDFAFCAEAKVGDV